MLAFAEKAVFLILMPYKVYSASGLTKRVLVSMFPKSACGTEDHFHFKHFKFRSFHKMYASLDIKGMQGQSSHNKSALASDLSLPWPRFLLQPP